MGDYLLDRRSWNAEELATQYRPRFKHPNKELLFKLGQSQGETSGPIGYSRWGRRGLPRRRPASDHALEIIAKPGHYEYSAQDSGDESVWHVNFANDDVFAYWSTALFAQDEIQVAEHPILINLRRAADEEGFSMYCVEDGSPTPLLFTHVARKLSITTHPTREWPKGLYGRQFEYASSQHVEAATRVLIPPTRTNLLAIEAPAYGEGRYTTHEVRFILETAYSGFVALKEEGQYLGYPASTTLNTGYWGCGAYGGNKTLMLVTQMLAADWAGLSRIVFHLGHSHAPTAFTEAVGLYQDLSKHQASPVAAIKRLVGMHFEWGESDGN